MKYYKLVFVFLLLSACGGGGSNSVEPVSKASSTTTSNVVSQCINPYKSDYPDVYKGPWPIPTPSEKFKTSYIRSIMLKDFFPGNYASTDKGSCTTEEFNKLMYTITLDRLKALNVDETWLINYGPWQDGTKSIWTMDKSNYQIPEEMVTFFVTEAKKRNIKVNLVWQFFSVDSKGYTMFNHGDTLTNEMMTTVLESHKLNIIELAKYAENVGINALALDWNAMTICCPYTTHKELFVTKMVETADEIRKNFKGKISFGQSMLPFYDERLLSKIDFIHLDASPRLTYTEFANLSVENIKYKTLIYIEQLHKNMKIPYGAKLPPVEFVATVQSRDKFFLEGSVEDGFCVSGKNSDGSINPCIQKTYVTDFSAQAVGIEGIFQAIKEQSYFQVYGVNLHTSFWPNDALQPRPEKWDDNLKVNNTDFPNLSQSIRGKPAQEIVKYWYSR